MSNLCHVINRPY